MKAWGIRARVLLLALLPSVMILVSLVGYFTYARITEVNDLVGQRGVALARQLASGAAFAIVAADRTALQRLTDAMALERDVASVAIAGTDGHELAITRSLDRTEATDVVRYTQPVMNGRQPVSGSMADMGFANPPRQVGEIVIEMSREAAHAEQRRLLAIGLGLGFACIIVAVALAFIIGNGVIRPIRRLAGAMAELTRGHPVTPLPLHGGGELRALHCGFNEMAARLQASTRELESRVEAATRELSAQRDMAEQATRARSRFIAAASHDLRQPLHAIGLFTATLQRRTQGTGVQSVVADLARSVSIMERLFDALLDVSRLDAGTLQAEVRVFRLEHLFAQIYAEHCTSAVQKQLRLRIRHTNALVATDELLLHRLLGNLVANAIRYTSRGTVLLCCRPCSSGLRVEVRDSGIGIDAALHAVIFEEFYQVDNPARDRTKGLGLGLAIVSRLARLLGTRVGVRSAPGRGSVFSLVVPSGAGTQVAAAALPPPVPAARDENPVG
jgi:signal transduction histidine kinase